jgi:hypothetical protein
MLGSEARLTICNIGLEAPQISSIKPARALNRVRKQRSITTRIKPATSGVTQLKTKINQIIITGILYTK